MSKKLALTWNIELTGWIVKNGTIFFLITQLFYFKMNWLFIYSTLFFHFCSEYIIDL